MRKRALSNEQKLSQEIEEVVVEDEVLEVLAAAQSLAEAFQGTVVDLPENWSGWSWLVDRTALSERVSSSVKTTDSLFYTSTPVEEGSFFEDPESNFEQIEPFEVVLGQDSCTAKTSGAWVSLNDLRGWYRQVYQDSQGNDLETLDQIAEVGQLFKSQFGDENPAQENWFSDWDAELLERWFGFYQSLQTADAN
ncbi:hypothetical protein ACQ4M3_20830 [Leptolyngbya sp. AN03gr2]|uniref:hypothetical protein n=1 Tax=unclassified Leptolyngbya TaxID=2650499 RepID=UPI003D322F7C